VGKLLHGEFPIIDIASIGVTLKGNLFGGKIDAGLIGGILKIDAAGRMIDPTDTVTPVQSRVFFVGVQGGFEFSGMGLQIRFALSELGPLSVFLSVEIPGGVPLPPVFQITKFSAGVDFFKTLPSIDDPFALRGSAFASPTTQTADAWLAGVKQQVVNQYLALKANPSQNGWEAAFTSPMLITGIAHIQLKGTPDEVFNADVTLRISTDGKFLIIGQLNFAHNALSISGRLYADLTKVTQGDTTVLFLADVPDQVRVLTIYGKLKTGFRDASGNEFVLTVPDEPPPSPTASLAGPRDGDSIALQELNGRAFVDVDFTMPAGNRLVDGSITDAAP